MKSSVYKGVSWSQYDRKWTAYLTKTETGDRQRHVGSFNTEEEARQARDRMLAAYQRTKRDNNDPLSARGRP